MRIRYFDNAATSFPKPPGVAAAMAAYMTEAGSPGRGTYAGAREGARLIHQCRERIRRLINGESAEHVVFTHNTTDALNLGLKGVIESALASRTGPVHIVTTWMEHNSVLRPMNAMVQREPRVEWTRVEADPATGLIDPDDIRRAIRAGQTALVAVNHASNVTGTIQPVEEIGRICRGLGVSYLVDGAQSLGHTPVDVRRMNIDLLAFPGHKGLLGPTGTGGLYIRPGVESQVATIREGGTGNVSEQETHPSMLPEKYEAGSHNIVGLVGLNEAAGWLLERGVDALRAHELELIAPMLNAIEAGELEGLTLLGPREADRRVGVFSFTHTTLDPQEIAAALETEFGILTRAGLHCAPLVHRAFGTAPPAGRGAVRLSVGPFLTVDDVRFAIDSLSAICRDAKMSLA